MTHNVHTGMSRTRVARNHALICAESHVPILFPQWPACESVVMISPEMGAKFSQHLITFHAGGSICPLRAEEEWFVLVLEGSLTLEAPGQAVDGTALEADGFVCLPASAAWQASAPQGARALAFSKPFVEGRTAMPSALAGNLKDVPAEPFLGDPDALLQVLLPGEEGFDWGINVFEFSPGATLPQVESHFMEHGLYLLDGQGVYRLGDDWYPVLAGDAIWMGPYLPQWFAATGKHNSRYIYYKEMNRAPIAAP